MLFQPAAHKDVGKSPQDTASPGRPGCRQTTRTGSCCRFASREALGLRYKVCREDTRARYQRKAEKLWSRLGQNGERPKRMHWRTYARIGEAAEDAEARPWCALLRRLGPDLLADD